MQREITVVHDILAETKREEKKTKLQREQYDDIFSQLIVPNFFNRIIKLLESLRRLMSKRTRRT